MGLRIGRYDLGYTPRPRGRALARPEHTFDGGCNGEGRLRRRHAGDEGADERLPGGQGHLPEPGLDPIHNYMDYSYDICYNEFTAGQVARAQDASHWLYLPGGA